MADGRWHIAYGVSHSAASSRNQIESTKDAKFTKVDEENFVFLRVSLSSSWIEKIFVAGVVFQGQFCIAIRDKR